MLKDKTFKQVLTRGKDGFQPGISDIAVGRFAGFRDELPLLCSFLTYETDGNTAMMFGGRKYYLLPPAEYSMKKIHTWTGTRATIKYNRGGPQKMRMTASLLAPGVHLSFTESFFALRMQYGLQAEHVAFATRKGIKINSPVEKYDGYGRIYNRKTDGDIVEPWLLVWWQECDQPVLILMEKHPEKMDTQATSGIIKGHYRGSAGNMTVMPLWGIRKYRNNECGGWKKKGIPNDVLAQIRYWVRHLQDYPCACDESFRIDHGRNTVEIRNTFDYISNRSDWKAAREFIAPISPLVAHAMRHGYPVKLRGEMVRAANTMTGYGPFPYVKGKAFTYTIPYAKGIDNIVAPLRIENDPRYDKHVKQIEKYIRNPKWTYGGDYDYVQGSIMDAFHDIRIMAWTTWSLDEKRRVELFKALEKPILKVSPDAYHHEVEPFSGQEFWWDKQCFDLDGVIQFDFEWYNGMNLGAPWAYYQYGYGITTKKHLAKLYPYMKKWVRNIEMGHDWVFLGPPVTIPGFNLNVDGNMHATCGVVAHARVAHLMGEENLADRMRYLASKMFINWYDVWLAPEWAVEKIKWGLTDRKLDPDKEAAIMMYHGNGVGRGGVGFWANTYGDVETDLLEFYRTHIYDKMKDFEYRKWEEWSKTDSKHWPTKPIIHGNERKVQWGWNAERAVRHYCLDPHFIARALVFHEGLEQQKDYGDKHTAQALEAFMVGAHPMALFPTGARFGGNVWNEKTKKLTTTLIRDVDDKVTVIIECGNKPKDIRGCRTWKYVKNRAYAEVEFKGRKKAVLESMF